MPRRGYCVENGPHLNEQPARSPAVDRRHGTIRRHACLSLGPSCGPRLGRDRGELWPPGEDGQSPEHPHRRPSAALDRGDLDCRTHDGVDGRPGADHSADVVITADHDAGDDRIRPCHLGSGHQRPAPDDDQGRHSTDHTGPRPRGLVAAWQADDRAAAATYADPAAVQTLFAFPREPVQAAGPCVPDGAAYSCPYFSKSGTSFFVRTRGSHRTGYLVAEVTKSMD